MRFTCIFVYIVPVAIMFLKYYIDSLEAERLLPIEYKAF